MEEPTTEGMDQPTTKEVEDVSTEGFGGFGSFGGFKFEWILILIAVFLLFSGGGFGGLFGEE
ncbi:hypothetical protein [Acetohalobium arabaticum]|uniref:Uncharacterized protein n=1 Tax=Acetohalobium arabaticum (strain ATCC 49924 / DSM 5501 / Z-7288) TaxID=574087 RepID=D9QSM9_ACEAZ|nr:hypothetical protein [Acetohalobium arabaticum]ADL13492.1 hypothetical protein Acear_1995 [Acetohalobium arabaticum DSM 5501]